MQYFDFVKIKNDIKVSCDMLRLSFSMNEKNAKQFNLFINNYEISHLNLKVKYFSSLTPFQFRNLINIVNLDDNTSFAMGIGFNGAKASQYETCFIEFNPNKTLTNNLVTPFLEFIKRHTNNLDIVRYDIAFDIPLPRDIFNLVKDRRNYKKIYSLILNSSNLDNFTEYLGNRQNNGYVKLYNKQIESNLQEPLTRLEITLDKLEYDNLITEMPQLVSFTIKNDLSKLNDSERVLVSLLLQNDNKIQYLNSLGRYLRDKLTPYICESYPLEIAETEFYEFIKIINKIVEGKI